MPNELSEGAQMFIAQAVAQGHPERITEPGLLRRVAVLLRHQEPKR